MVLLAQGSSGQRAQSPPQEKIATVILGLDYHDFGIVRCRHAADHLERASDPFGVPLRKRPRHPGRHRPGMWGEITLDPWATSSAISTLLIGRPTHPSGINTRGPRCGHADGPPDDMLFFGGVLSRGRVRKRGIDDWSFELAGRFAPSAYDQDLCDSGIFVGVDSCAENYPLVRVLR